MRRSIPALTVLFLIGVVSSASADTIIITPDTQTQWSGTDLGNPDAEDVAQKVGYSGVLELLYKQDVGESSDTGPFAGSYQTTFTNSVNDPANATIAYISGNPAINVDPLYLLVKDGQGVPISPWWYIYDMRNLTINGSSYSWNGTDTIELQGFWPEKGAISHVSIFGAVGAVPDSGATLLLLLAAVVALGAVSGMIKR